MDWHILDAFRRTPSPPIDIITYRYKGDLVYAPVALDYTRALAHAREAFPQLPDLRHVSLSLSLRGHEHKFVSISAPVWPKLVPHLVRYQIIDVHVAQSDQVSVLKPDVRITYADADGPKDMTEELGLPPYLESDVVSAGIPPSPSRMSRIRTGIWIAISQFLAAGGHGSVKGRTH